MYMSCLTSVLILLFVFKGCAIYKDGDSVFVSKILEGCDAEQSGKSRALHEHRHYSGKGLETA